MIYDWYETWVDESPAVPYVLFVFPDPTRIGGVVVIDPKEDDKVVHQAPDYESARMWLLEDEYTQVAGRAMPGGIGNPVVAVAEQQKLVGNISN